MWHGVCSESKAETITWERLFLVNWADGRAEAELCTQGILSRSEQLPKWGGMAISGFYHGILSFRLEKTPRSSSPADAPCPPWRFSWQFWFFGLVLVLGWSPGVNPCSHQGFPSCVPCSGLHLQTSLGIAPPEQCLDWKPGEPENGKILENQPLLGGDNVTMSCVPWVNSLQPSE